MQAVTHVAQSQGLTYSLNAAQGPGLSHPSPQPSMDGSLLNTMGSDMPRHQARPSQDSMTDFLDFNIPQPTAPLARPPPQQAAYPQYPAVMQQPPMPPHHQPANGQVNYPTIEPPAPNGSPIWGLPDHSRPEPPAPSRFADAAAQAPHAAQGGGIWLGGTQPVPDGPGQGGVTLRPTRQPFGAQLGERTPSASSLDNMPLPPSRAYPSQPQSQPQQQAQGGQGMGNRLGALRQPMQDILRKVRPERENTPPPFREAQQPDPNRHSPARRPRCVTMLAYGQPADCMQSGMTVMLP